MKKRFFVRLLACAAALLTLYGTYVLGAKSAPKAQTVACVSPQSADYYVNLRQRRDKTRTGELEALKTAQGCDDEALSSSAAQYQMELIKNMEDELVIEQLVLSKGYDDACVLISSSGVNIIISAVSVSQEAALRLRDAAVRQTGLDASDVFIILN